MANGQYNTTKKLLAISMVGAIGFTTISPALTASAQTINTTSTDPYENIGQGQELPDKVYAPFVDFTDWVPGDGYGGAPSLVKLSQGEGANYYNIGFIQAVGGTNTSGSLNWGFGGLPSLGEDSTSEQYEGMKKSISDFRAQGGDVIVSFGGASGTPFWMATQDVDTLTKTYVEIIEDLNLKTIDLDIEGAGENVAYNVANAQAIKNAQDITGVDVNLTLPVLPSGLTYTGNAVLNAYIDAGVDINNVNLMTMCFGTNAAPNGYAQGAIDSIDSTKDQIKAAYADNGINITDDEAYQKLGTTPSIGFEGENHPIFTESDFQKVVTDAENHNLGMLSFWAANRDAKIGGYSSNKGVNTAYKFGEIGRQFDDADISIDTLAPSTPTNVTVTNPKSTSAQIQFTSSQDNKSVVGYNVYLNGLKTGTILANTTATISNLIPNTSYVLQLQAYDKAGNVSAKSDAVSFTTTAPDTTAPSQVANLKVINNTQTSFVVNWTAATDNIGVDHYEVTINGKTYNTTTNSFTATNLVANTNYEVSVVAVDEVGNKSNLVTTHTKTLSADAYDLNKEYSTPGTKVTYNGNIYENSYWIGKGVTPDANDRNGSLTGWKMVGGVDYNTVPQWVNYLSYQGGSHVIYQGKEYNAKYWAATNSIPGKGAEWELVNSSPSNPSQPVNDVTAPTTPTNVLVSDLTTNSATINFNSSTDNVGVVGYKIYVNEVYKTTTTATSYSLSNLNANTNYNVAISAVDAAGNESNKTTVVNFTTKNEVTPDTTTPSAPINLAVGNITTNGASYSFVPATNNENVTNYKIYVNGNYYTSTPTNSGSLTNLAANTTYTIQVSAVNAIGNESVKTNPVTFKTNAETVSSDTVPNYNSATVYTQGQRVKVDDKVYEAKWWVQGENPATSEAWTQVSGSVDQTWSSTKAYNAGDTATYNGHTYKAKWWTKGDNPTSSAPWQLIN